jgi:hypothetical protein
LRKYVVHYKVTGRPDNPHFGTRDVEASDFVLESGFICFYSGDGHKVFGVAQDRVWYIEEA